MNVLLTGASGFIGAHTTRALLRRNHRLTVVALPGDPLTRLSCVLEQIDVLVLSLDDADAVRKAVLQLKPEACIHLAWYAEPGQYLHSPKNLAALASSLSLFQALAEAGCRRMVGAGTCLEYDTDYGYLREDSPVKPASLYAAAKLSCGLLGEQLAGASGTSFAWGRIFNPYGPQEDLRRLVPAAVAALADGRPFESTAGDQIRDYIHVADVASAFCLLAEGRDSGVFNISSGLPVAVRRILEMLAGLLKRPDLLRHGALPYRAGDPPFICGCNDRLKALGWQPSFSLAEGLADTIRAAEESKR